MQRPYLTSRINAAVRLALFGVTCLSAAWMSSAASAQDGSAPTGMKALTIGGGARAVGMAETMVADESDPFVLEYNPAGLAAMPRAAVAFSHNQFFVDTRGEYVSAAVPIGSWAVGGRAGYLGTDDIPYRTGPSEQPLALYDAADGVFQGAVARRFNSRVAAGISAGYVLSHIDNQTAQSAVFGLGLQYKQSPSITWGAAFANMGPQAKFDETKFKMPNRFRLGGAWQHNMFSLRGELVAPDDENAKWHLGAEVTPDPRIAFRAGLKLGYDAETFSAGLGAQTPDGRFAVDYAFAPYSDGLGDTHRFGLVVRP